MDKKKRDYTYDKAYESSEKQKHNRALRNKNRREALRKGTVHKGDGMDLDHCDGNPKNNSKTNIKAIPKSKNRAKH